MKCIKAKQSDKRISAYNKAVIKKQWTQTALIAVFYLAIRLTFRRKTVKPKFIYGFIALQVITVIMILLMKKMAYIKGANPSVQYAAFSDFYWWFLLVIPVYAVYKIFASVILPILRASTAQNPSPEQVLSKTQQKKQAKRERVKYA
ncbi:hypothetical protein PIROE2DRAFT_18796 [Piromyces sp. E2]|nr:hypothetical protein PIROE2DRAFT_18796 [Piromyces sp. E2]|eukprot:OUM56551.1 hypothetical protein PIROE2DRAFT_18796 [Piromyces sp. E2]